MPSATPGADDRERKEAEEAEHRRSPSGAVIYQSVEREAEEELERGSWALFWSGLAAGLAMGFSMIGQGLLRHHLPADATWSPLVSMLGYTFGFLLVILGRQQLFTENTLTPILPLLRKRDAGTLVNVLRLWGIVLLANLIGALLIALVSMRAGVFDAAVRDQFVQIGHEVIAPGFGTVLVRAIFAGWLIAMLVWMLPYAQTAHVWVILAITWLIGIGHFSHIVAGAVEVFALGWTGEKPWGTIVGGFLVPALIGNIMGGTALVAALNYAQVHAGERK